MRKHPVFWVLNDLVYMKKSGHVIIIGRFFIGMVSEILLV